MRKITMIVGNTPIGLGITWAYPFGDAATKTYQLPTYHLTVSGIDLKGASQQRKFEVFRFGVQKESPLATPSVVGLAEAQTHVIKRWIPTYTVHSARSAEVGAWQVYKNFLIHDGPDNPMGKRQIYATIGCIEICGGPNGFNKFNDFIIELAGSNAKTRPDKLLDIGKSGKLSITYLAAQRPKLS
jgi:hypothetical protein